MHRLIPVVGERSANQTACQHGRCEVGQIGSENAIACDAKGSCAEDSNVQEDDGCADKSHSGDPEKLSYKADL